MQLLAGDIGRIDRNATYIDGVPGQYQVAGQAAMSNSYLQDRALASPPPPSPTSETVGEVHLYSLPEHVTFIPGVQTVVPLFDPTSVKPERKLTLAGSLNYYGGLGQSADEQSVPVGVAYRLERKLSTPFGDLALPAGMSVSMTWTRAGGCS